MNVNTYNTQKIIYINDILFSYFTFFMIYASRLPFCEPFLQCGLLCLFFVVFFPLDPMLSILHELLDTSTVQLLTK